MYAKDLGITIKNLWLFRSTILDNQRITLSNFLGTIARKGRYCPLNYEDWRLVLDSYKEEMLNIVKVMNVFFKITLMYICWFCIFYFAGKISVITGIWNLYSKVHKQEIEKLEKFFEEFELRSRHSYWIRNDWNT